MSITDELFLIGEAFIKDRAISLKDATAHHVTAPDQEVYFTYPLVPEVRKDKKTGKINGRSTARPSW